MSLSEKNGEYLDHVTSLEEEYQIIFIDTTDKFINLDQQNTSIVNNSFEKKPSIRVNLAQNSWTKLK